MNKFLYLKGGSEKYVFDLAEILRRNGHQIEFFGMEDSKNIVETPKEELVKNIDFHRKSFSMIFYPLKIIYSREARQKMGKMIRRFHPDIVHLNNYNFQITPSILYELKAHKIPALQTLHDPLLVCPAHLLYNSRTGTICEKCKGRKYLNCLKSRCIHGSLSRSALGMVEAYLYDKLKTYDYIQQFICPSRFLANKMVDFGVNPEKVMVVPNFISSETYNKIPRERNYFLYFGRLSKEKGISTLLLAIKALPHIRFAIAGSGPLENLMNEMTNVAWVGFKYGEELKELICGSIATICPSEWYENSPMSILESLALGIPVIGANIGGIPELIQDKSNGLLFEPGNINDLVDKIEYFYKRKDQMDIYSENCIESSAHLSADRYYEKIMSIYENAI